MPFTGQEKHVDGWPIVGWLWLRGGDGRMRKWPKLKLPPGTCPVCQGHGKSWWCDSGPEHAHETPCWNCKGGST